MFFSAFENENVFFSMEVVSSYVLFRLKSLVLADEYLCREIETPVRLSHSLIVKSIFEGILFNHFFVGLKLNDNC